MTYRMLPSSQMMTTELGFDFVEQGIVTKIQISDVIGYGSTEIFFIISNF